MFSRHDALLAEIARHGLLFVEGSVVRNGRRHLVHAGRLDPRFPEASELARRLHALTASLISAALCLGHLLNEGPTSPSRRS